MPTINVDTLGSDRQVTTKKMISHLKRRVPKGTRGLGFADKVRPVIGAYFRQTGCCNNLHTSKILNYIRRRIASEGSPYLRLSAKLPILGARVLGGDLLQPSDLKGYKSRVIEGQIVPCIFSSVFARLIHLSRAKATPKNAKVVKRILSALSFAKFYNIKSKKAYEKAKADYAKRLTVHNTQGPDPDSVEVVEKKIVEFTKFLKVYDPDGWLSFDPSSFSMKPFNRPYNRRGILKVPPYFYYLTEGEKGMVPLISNGKSRGDQVYEDAKSTFMRGFWEFKLKRDNIDGKLSIITEKAGKYRGICPYSSPYHHSVNLYARCREALNNWNPDSSMDQRKGQVKTQNLTLTNNGRETIVSADSSNFTDTISEWYTRRISNSIGCRNIIEYLSRLNIDAFGKIIHTRVPMMGFKGTFELGSLCLAFSCWYNGLDLKSLSHCCDDLCGLGTYEEYERSYNMIGCSLNRSKTIVSKTVATFCGKIYWLGYDISPVSYCIQNLKGRTGEILSRVRDFIENSRGMLSGTSRKIIFGILVTELCKIRCDLLFDIPSKLRGVPLRSTNEPLLKRIERNKKQCCYSIPFDEQPLEVIGKLYGLLPLGPSYKFLGIPTEKSKIEIPKPARSAFRKKKIKVTDLVNSQKMGSYDVLEYFLYDRKFCVP